MGSSKGPSAQEAQLLERIEPVNCSLELGKNVSIRSFVFEMSDSFYGNKMPEIIACHQMFDLSSFIPCDSTRVTLLIQSRLLKCLSKRSKVVAGQIMATISNTGRAGVTTICMIT